MRSVEISVIVSVSRDYFLPSLSFRDFPEGVNGSLISGSAGIDRVRSGAVLLVTDNAGLIRAFLNRRLDRSYSVYIGEKDDLGSLAETVTDIWSPFDEGDVLKKRYMLLLDYIKNCTLLKFYQDNVLL